MGDGLGQVPVVALLAVVAVPPGRVVAAVEADSSALPPRQLVQLHVEPASPGMQVAVTRWGGTHSIRHKSTRVEQSRLEQPRVVQSRLESTRVVETRVA